MAMTSSRPFNHRERCPRCPADAVVRARGYPAAVDLLTKSGPGPEHRKGRAPRACDHADFAPQIAAMAKAVARDIRAVDYGRIEFRWI